MNQELQEYVAKVEAFEIDPGDKRLDFTGRLARENNWSYRLAERVILSTNGSVFLRCVQVTE